MFVAMATMAVATPALAAARHQFALVTGGNSGIGLAIAEELGRQGFSLVLTARDVGKLAAAKAQVLAAGSPEVTTVACDLSDSASVQKLGDDIIARHGGVGVLVNNAGTMVDGNPLNGSPDEWEKMMAINVAAPMRLTRMLAEGMASRGGGMIINIGSIASVEAMSGDSAAYAASKHALRGWSTSSYLTLRHKNVKVCLINPAFVNTPLLGAIPEDRVHR